LGVLQIAVLKGKKLVNQETLEFLTTRISRSQSSFHPNKKVYSLKGLRDMCLLEDLLKLGDLFFICVIGKCQNEDNIANIAYVFSRIGGGLFSKILWVNSIMSMKIHNLLLQMYRPSKLGKSLIRVYIRVGRLSLGVNEEHNTTKSIYESLYYNYFIL